MLITKTHCSYIWCDYHLHQLLLPLFWLKFSKDDLMSLIKPHLSGERGLPLSKRAIQTTNEILPRIIGTLVKNHAIQWIDWNASKFVGIFTSEVRNKTSITDYTSTRPHLYLKLWSRAITLWSFRTLSTTTVSTPASRSNSPNSSTTYPSSIGGCTYYVIKKLSSDRRPPPFGRAAAVRLIVSSILCLRFPIQKCIDLSL